MKSIFKISNNVHMNSFSMPAIDRYILAGNSNAIKYINALNILVSPPIDNRENNQLPPKKPQ
jgi:hypothetical protein